MEKSALSKKFSILDRHHKMERFGVIFVAFVLVAGLIFGAGVSQKHEDDTFDISEQSMYTTETKWSITEQEIVVKNVFRNDDMTRVFVTLQMPETSMKEFSTNASDYRVFVLSDDETGKIRHDMSGSYYVFGSTGYMGIYLNDTKGFEKGLAHLVVRNEAKITSKTDTYKDPSTVKDTFEKFNQIEVLVNLGGNSAPIAESLNATDLNLSNLYAECVVYDELDAQKTALSDVLSQINANTSIMFENKRRLESYGFTVPFPSCLNGDYITTDPSNTTNNATDFENRMLSGNITDVIQTVYNDYDNEQSSGVQYYTAGDVLYMVTDFVFPGGYQFNYQNIKPTERYLDYILKDGVSYTAWRNEKTAEYEEYAKYVWFDENAKWVLDGVEYDASGTDSLTKSYNDTIAQYKTSVKKVIELKQQYQTEDIYKYLDIENTINNIPRLTSVNSDKEVIHVFN